MLVAAFDPALNGKRGTDNSAICLIVADVCPSDPRGVYLNECQIGEAAPHATDTEAADRLWHLSEHLVDQKFDLGSNAQAKDPGKL